MKHAMFFVLSLAIAPTGCAAGEEDSVAASGGSAGSGEGGSAAWQNGADAQVPSCDDGAKNGNEADVDCGGLCVLCADGRSCQKHSDCASSSCQAGVCAPASCDDGLRNAAETDVDCGGGTCPDCAVCATCAADADCEPGLCQDALCVPTIEIISATYAANCGAPTPVQTIVDACNKQQTCNYVFDYTKDIGSDPAYGCYKALEVKYQCSGGSTTKTYYESCAPCDPQNTPTQIKLELECQTCIGPGEPPA